MKVVERHDAFNGTVYETECGKTILKSFDGAWYEIKNDELKSIEEPQLTYAYSI